MKSACWVPMGIALACAACVEDEVGVRVQDVVDEVQFANRDPGGACRNVAAIEVRSGRNDLPSSEMLRAYAEERGANFVVIDTFSVCEEHEEAAVLTRARLFRCPLACAATR
jgi:hypothetical protein